MKIELKNIEFSYSTKQILDIENVVFEKGEISVVLGPSGCGKTTLLRCISLLEIYKGEILFDGNKIPSIIDSDLNISFVFQDFALYQGLSVKENIIIALKSRNFSKKEIEKKLTKICTELNICNIIEKNINEISGGEKQRVSIARSLILEPDILLMDEPFSSLDYNIKNSITNTFIDYHKSINNTVIIVTHNQSEASEIADKIFLMNKGKIIQSGSYDELYNKPNSKFVAEFIGSIPINKVSYNNNEIFFRPENVKFDILKNKKDFIQLKTNYIRFTVLDSYYIYKFEFSEKTLNVVNKTKIDFTLNEEVVLFINNKDILMFE